MRTIVHHGSAKDCTAPKANGSCPGHEENAPVKDAVLLYQGGLANVFNATPMEPLRRLLQDAFVTCEAFAAGLIAAGVKVRVMNANVAGDATLSLLTWKPGKGGPFEDKQNPPNGATND